MEPPKLSPAYLLSQTKHRIGIILCHWRGNRIVVTCHSSLRCAAHQFSVFNDRRVWELVSPHLLYQRLAADTVRPGWHRVAHVRDLKTRVIGENLHAPYFFSPEIPVGVIEKETSVTDLVKDIFDIKDSNRLYSGWPSWRGRVVKRDGETLQWRLSPVSGRLMTKKLHPEGRPWVSVAQLGAQIARVLERSLPEAVTPLSSVAFAALC